jgi:hypothetical protein
MTKNERIQGQNNERKEPKMNQQHHGDRISDTWLRGAYNVVDKIEYVAVTLWDRVFTYLERNSSSLEESPQSETRSRLSS